ncbi:MAG TPA: ABC-F family ATP-binding cassette domain-containing protein [Syntrophales bacterium]|nr:ABC-F family ATP-binding cassette domain-containing protein [Syntrophales bacterium]HPQ44693.1 ABC-F family ATP-binding cassette domain-containing protein [Syntrophales bacterium]
MISLQAISKQFSGKYLFRDLSLHIDDGNRIAFVGRNGTGKSTLMKIILGEIETDSGKIVQSRFNSVGYLPQDSVYHTGHTLFEEAATAFDDLIRLHERIRDIGNEIEDITSKEGGNSPRLQERLDEMGQAQSILEHRGGYNIEMRVQQILSGLGFKETDMSRMTEEFSGGWQMRIALAKLLLREPTILLLDEPTNHLDMESLEWLEGYLKSYQGSLVLVSHDSRFLDNLVERVIEISMGKATEYTGDYSSYLIQKAQRQELLESSLKNQQRMIDSTNRFIERFRYKSTKAKQVQSRVKKLEKIERIEIDKEESSIFFDFPDPPHTGRVIMELDALTKSYGDHTVLDGISLTIERGDRIALLGVNGSGKSTLARIIADVDTFQGGSRKQGPHALISYYAQNIVEELDPNKTALQTLDMVAPLKSPGELRTLLGSFLFKDDDVFKPVSVLSGGEKSRLALARMILQPANLLIMDEPTNHLDVQSKAILQHSLMRFSGAYVIVSHDRDFLAPLVNKVAVLREDGLVLYHGTVDDYLDKQHREEEEISRRKDLQDKGISGQNKKTQKRAAAENRQQLYKKLKPLKDTLETIEREIAACEKKKLEIENAFADQGTYANETLIQSLNIEYSRITARLDSLYETWTETEEKIGDMTGTD